MVEKQYQASFEVCFFLLSAFIAKLFFSQMSSFLSEVEATSGTTVAPCQVKDSYSPTYKDGGHAPSEDLARPHPERAQPRPLQSASPHPNTVRGSPSTG